MLQFSKIPHIVVSQIQGPKTSTSTQSMQDEKQWGGKAQLLTISPPVQIGVSNLLLFCLDLFPKNWWIQSGLEPMLQILLFPSSSISMLEGYPKT